MTTHDIVFWVLGLALSVIAYFLREVHVEFKHVREMVERKADKDDVRMLSEHMLRLLEQGGWNAAIPFRKRAKRTAR